MFRTYHNPFHLKLDNQIYWISASTYHRSKLLNNAGKEIMRDLLKDLIQQRGHRLYAWGILDNHYHLLLHLKSGSGLPIFLKLLHGRSSRFLNRSQGLAGRKIWYQYWDRCIRGEADFYRRFNYIHHNPVKHGYVVLPEHYEYSSYNYYLRKHGEEWLADIFRSYPIVDFAPQEADE